MSFNIKCYTDLIEQEIEHALIYDNNDTSNYSTIVYRAVYVELIKRKTRTINDIKIYQKEIEEWINKETCQDGSIGQAEAWNGLRKKCINKLLNKLMEIKRIKEMERE